MKTRFIIPIDYSSYSESQLILAFEWSRKVLAELLVVHYTVIDVPYITDPVVKERAMDVERDEAYKKLQAYVETVIPSAKNVKYLIVETALDEAIKDIPREGYADMIFTGLKGTGLLKKIFIGSNTVRLIENLNELVVCVPKRMKMNVPDTLYVAVHYKYSLNIEALETLLSVFYFKIKKIHLISVLKDTDEADKAALFMELLTERTIKLANTTTEIFKGNDAQQELKNFMMKQESGILVIQQGGRTQYEPEFRSFMINELVYDGSIPMIVLPA